MLCKDDFVVVPLACDFTLTSIEPPPSDAADALLAELADGVFSIGDPQATVEVEALGGHCCVQDWTSRRLAPTEPGSTKGVR